MTHKRHEIVLSCHEQLTGVRFPDGSTRAAARGFTNKFVYSNHRGDTLVVLDCNYTIAARYEYDAFGNVIEQTDYTPRYLFSTKEYLPDARLYLYAYRVYDPIAGRWTQRDPIDYQDSINLYQFCGNNPVNTTDRDGRISEVINAEHIPDEFTDIKQAAMQDRAAGRQMLIDFMKLLLIDVPFAMTAPMESMLDPLVDTMIDNAPLRYSQKLCMGRASSWCSYLMPPPQTRHQHSVHR